MGSYFVDRVQGVGAVAADDRAPRSAPAPSIRAAAGGGRLHLATPQCPSSRWLKHRHKPGQIYCDCRQGGRALGDTGTSTEVRSPTSTSTEVRSPTSTSTEVRSPTSTSTDAYTAGNVTVTGGAGAGANTYVHVYRTPVPQTRADQQAHLQRSRGAADRIQRMIDGTMAPRAPSPMPAIMSATGARRTRPAGGSRMEALSGPGFQTAPPQPQPPPPGVITGPKAHTLQSPWALVQPNAITQQQSWTATPPIILPPGTDSGGLPAPLKSQTVGWNGGAGGGALIPGGAELAPAFIPTPDDLQTNATTGFLPPGAAKLWMVIGAAGAAFLVIRHLKKRR